MTSRWPFPRREHVGVALAADRIVAVLPGEDMCTPWTRALAPPGDGGILSPDLGDALAALREAVVEARGGAANPGRLDPVAGLLHVAVLPPLGRLRRLDMPGLGIGEARQVVLREPSRYLPLAASALELEIDIDGEGWRRSSPFTVLAVARELVDGLHAAARRNGWRTAEIVSAEAAWAAAARSLLPDAPGDERALVVCLDQRLEVLRVRDGRVVAVRRVPGSTPEAATLAMSAIEGFGGRDARGRPSIAILGESSAAGELRDLLLERGVAVVETSADGVLRGSPATIAACFAPRAAGPALLPESERIALRRRAARGTVVRLAAAGAMVALSGVTALWGASRERVYIAGQRALVHAPVARALQVRDSLSWLSQRLATLHSAGATAPRWSALITSLSAELPDDAFLLSLRADADTLRLEGSATRAALVFDALGRIPGVQAVRPEGAIRQDVTARGAATERFVLSARLGGQP